MHVGKRTDRQTAHKHPSHLKKGKFQRSVATDFKSQQQNCVSNPKLSVSKKRILELGMEWYVQCTLINEKKGGYKIFKSVCSTMKGITCISVLSGY